MVNKMKSLFIILLLFSSFAEAHPESGTKLWWPEPVDFGTDVVYYRVYCAPKPSSDADPAYVPMAWVGAPAHEITLAQLGLTDGLWWCFIHAVKEPEPGLFIESDLTGSKVELFVVNFIWYSRPEASYVLEFR